MPLTVTIKPAGLTVTCTRGTSLLEVMREAGIPLQSSCGGNGTCGRCRIRILSGTIHPPSTEEIKHIPDTDLSDGYRLACQVRVAGDTTVDIPPPSLITQLTMPLRVMDSAVPLDPAVHDFPIEGTERGIPHDAQAIWRCIYRDLMQRHHLDIPEPDAAVLASLPDALRKTEGSLRISIRAREAISIRQADSTPCGLAIDLGTTTIAGYPAVVYDFTAGTTI